MISIREQQYGLDIALYNECTLADFKMFETALLKRVEEYGRPDVLLDLTNMHDFTIDVAIEDLRFIRIHERDFGRIAIVVTDLWIKLGMKIAELISHSHADYFSEIDTAKIWLHSK